MDSFLEHIAATIAARRLPPKSQRLLVAVSGGCDSMVLLSALRALAPVNRWHLIIAHLNHQLRGRSSDADERLVRRTAERLGLPLVVERAEVRQFARAHKLSLEMAARGLRHEFLARTAVARDTTHVALAHHADDQVELFLLRLLRGSGPEGLAGMPWSNPSPANPKLTLVRPLLDLAKQDLRDYATAHGIRFRQDASNASLDIQRNRLRHELLPLIRKQYQPALNRIVLRLMSILAAEGAFIQDAARAWLSETKKIPAGSGPALNSWRRFNQLPLGLQRCCVHQQLLKLGLRSGFDLVERLRIGPGKPVSISSGKTASRDALGVVRIQETHRPSFAAEALTVELGRRGEALFDGLKVKWRIERARGAARAQAAANCERFDAERVGSVIRLRHWQPGDRFQPIGMPVAVKLQDFFVNQRIPRLRRHELIVATTAAGEVFWVEGQRISERFKLTNRTTRRLLWTSMRR